MRTFGSRKHYDHASPIYREHSRRITREIADALRPAPGRRRLANRQRVGLPLLDPLLRRSQRPRPSRHGSKQRYGTLEALNEAWGNVFWSQEYSALGSDRTAAPDRRRAESVARARLLPLRQRRRRRVPARSGPRSCASSRPAAGSRTTTCSTSPSSTTTRTCEPLDFASWDSYPAGHAERDPPDRRGEVPLGAHRSPRPHLVQPRSLPRAEGRSAPFGSWNRATVRSTGRNRTPSPPKARSRSGPRRPTRTAPAASPTSAGARPRSPRN